MRPRSSSGSSGAAELSPDYGLRVPAPLLVYSIRRRLPLRLVTLLLPVEDASAPPPRVSARRGRRGALIFEETGERIEIDDDLVRVR